MTIHSSDPFATPDDAKSPVRRFRGRLPAAVTLWTAYGREERPAGLAVSSTLVVDGEPGRLVGVLDQESSLWEAVAHSGQFAVMPLQIGDGQLADRFAGLMPAPGGPFAQHEWRATRFGPVLSVAPAWVGCQLDDAHAIGWGLLVEATIVEVDLDGAVEPGVETAASVVAERDGGPATDREPLVYYRGRYSGGYPLSHLDG